MTTQEWKTKEREEISKILVNWSMPTRQSAINEILQRMESREKELKEELVKKIGQDKFLIADNAYKNGYENGRNDGYDKAVYITNEKWKAEVIKVFE